VQEAILLITLSLTYPESLENKPTLFDIDEPGTPNNSDIYYDYKNKPLTMANLESAMFNVIIFSFVRN